MKYPPANPILCNTNTDNNIIGKNVDADIFPKILELEDAILDDNICTFCATTPPHIKLTNKTDANGVNRPMVSANLGYLPRNIIPVITGANTTLAVAIHNADPDTCIGAAVVAVVAVVATDDAFLAVTAAADTAAT